MNTTRRYSEALTNLPVPGYGDGCHQRLLGIANLGAIAGLAPDRVFSDLRQAIPSGTRRGIECR